jgi:hypothetical protein
MVLEPDVRVELMIHPTFTVTNYTPPYTTNDHDFDVIAYCIEQAIVNDMA